MHSLGECVQFGANRFFLINLYYYGIWPLYDLVGALVTDLGLSTKYWVPRVNGVSEWNRFLSGRAPACLHYSLRVSLLVLGAGLFYWRWTRGLDQQPLA